MIDPKAIATRISADIDEYIIKEYDDGHRHHLGASQIGDECKRKLWYVFRWCFKETYKDQKNHARVQRLFNRGHREEDRFIEWLKGIGAQVWTHDSDGKQFRISGANGHFGGSMDGICRLPTKYGIDEPILLEFKTNGTGAGFDKTMELGMQLQKPLHFSQISTYGSDPAYNFNYCLYFIINKNDDSLHIELVKLNNELGAILKKKAEMIVSSQSAPARVSENPTRVPCVYCAAKEICHKGALPERNCRSCKNATPVANAEWYCGHHKAIIPRDAIPRACTEYKSITITAK